MNTLLRSALLVSLILQALRTMSQAAPETMPTPIPETMPEMEEEPERPTACAYDLPEDGSADALEIRRALNCWKSQGRPSDIFCPSGYGRFFNTSECWLRVYQFEVTPAPTPLPTAYPAPYP